MMSLRLYVKFSHKDTNVKDKEAKILMMKK